MVRDGRSSRPLSRLAGGARRVADAGNAVLLGSAFGAVFVFARTWGAVVAGASMVRARSIALARA